MCQDNDGPDSCVLTGQGLCWVPRECEGMRLYGRGASTGWFDPPNQRLFPLHSAPSIQDCEGEHTVSSNGHPLLPRHAFIRHKDLPTSSTGRLLEAKHPAQVTQGEWRDRELDPGLATSKPSFALLCVSA